jgi:hypothetical protein
MVKQDKDKDSKARPSDAKIQGEGDYEAARRYNEKTKEHAQSGDADQAAKDAEPASRGEQHDMEKAEEKGRERAKEEDPLLDHPDRISKEGK